MSLLKKFRKHWEKMQFALPEQSVLLAVSGGSDSMAMADLFLKSGLKFGIAHCNFGLREQESDLDEQLVKKWCVLNDVAFHNILFATKQKAEEWKKGTQETARNLRYEWFEQIRAEHNYAKIATAHHANDNVETLIINLFKGTGIGGMHGILPRNGHIIRPLLFASKELIAAYITEQNIAYRDDASNASDDYLRNAVRHNVIPAIQQLFPTAIDSANESIGRFAEAELLYNKAIDQERSKLIEKRGNDHYISLLKLKHRKPLGTICYELFEQFGFTARQLQSILNLFDAESGHYIVSDTHRIIRNRNFFIVTTIPTATADMVVIDNIPCSVVAGKFKYTFAVQEKPKTITADKDVAILDMKDITMPVMLRKWKTGDYLYPFGMKMKKKKVSRLLVDEKVALHDKEDIRILECNKRIAWVSGIRPDERFRVTDSTNQVLVVRRVPADQ